MSVGSGGAAGVMSVSAEAADVRGDMDAISNPDDDDADDSDMVVLFCFMCLLVC